MAKIRAEIGGNSTVLEPPTVAEQSKKTRGARPPSGGAPAGEFDYSRFKVAFRNTEAFAKYLAGYPDLSGVLAYIYRLQPKIDLSLIGLPETSLLKTARVDQMTADFCARTWGNGTFMLKLNDANRVKGQQEVARTWFTVDEPDLVPVYDPRTLLLSEPANADEIARLLQSGVLVRDAVTGSPRVRTEATSAAAAGAAVASSLPVSAPVAPDLSTALLSKLVDRAFPSFAPPVSPTEQLNQSFAIADRLRGPVAETPSVEQVADAVVARLQRSGAAPGAAAPEDPFAVYERIDAVLERVGAGRGRAEAGGWQDTLIKVLVPVVAPLVPMLGQFLQARAVPQTAVNGLGAAPVQSAPMRAVPYAGTPATAPTGQDATNGGEKMPPQQQQPDLMTRVVALARLALQKQADGMHGFDFAAYLVGFEPGGLELFRLLEERGSVGALGLMAMVPDLAGQIAVPERRAAVEAFLDDFLTYDPAGSDEAAG